MLRNLIRDTCRDISDTTNPDMFNTDLKRSCLVLDDDCLILS